MTSGTGSAHRPRRDAGESTPERAGPRRASPREPELGLPRTQWKVRTAPRELPLKIVAGRG